MMLLPFSNASPIWSPTRTLFLVVPLSLLLTTTPFVLAQTFQGGDVLTGITSAGEECTCEVPTTAASTSSILLNRPACDPTDVETCQANCANIHGIDNYLSDKCCLYSGQSASLLAFEEDRLWVPRIEEFNRCTGASVRLEYLPEGEDGMAAALRNDLGDDIFHESGQPAGQGIFDAYIVQAPWLWDVVNGLENLSPLIRENADTVKFLDINPASRSAVSYNGTVRALPLDTDYIALGWRQDVFHKYNIPPELSPPRTIQDLAKVAKQLNGLDFNNDGQGDWGVCLTPQVNYFYAFVAPLMQTALRDPITGTQTGQNMFFSADTFEPLIRQPSFRAALELYWTIIRNSNCQEQLVKGEKCDRKTAFPTGRCAMVISMPGTLTKMLLDGAKYAPAPRINETTGEVEWDINNEPLGQEGGSYWGRRAPFPGSTIVQKWDADAGFPLVECDKNKADCPHAGEDGINYAPFFAEGGEAYAINGRQSKPAAKRVMWDMFTWLSELPETELPLSGQYRKSHLNEDHRVDLTEGAGWPNQMVDDLFEVLKRYFQSEEDGGNPVQDLLMLGFPDYMDALDEELHDRFLGVDQDSTSGLFDRTYPAESIDPENDQAAFEEAFYQFLDALEKRYNAISDSMSGGQMGQLQRWRQSLNLPWRTDEELCVEALGSSNDVTAFQRLHCPSIVDFAALCQTEPENVALYDEEMCDTIYGGDDSENLVVLIPAILIPLVVLAGILAYVYVERKKRSIDSIWAIKQSELRFDEPPVVVGRGSFGLVLLAEYRGTQVAVKKVVPPKDADSKNTNMTSTLIGTGNLRMDSWAMLSASDFESRLPTNEMNQEQPRNISHVSTISEDNSCGDEDEELEASTTSSYVRNNAEAENGQGSGSGVHMFSETVKRPTNNNKSRMYNAAKTMGLFGTSDQYERLKANFISEMRYLSKLRHPCITTLMGAVTEKGVEPQLVMEYCQNGSLYDMIHNETVPLDGDVLQPILSDICQGMRFLHAATPNQVIHGDIKSANILVDNRFRAKVADFGLSGKSNKGLGGVTGTPLWMAPELLLGESANSTASDVYGFGIVLYEVYSRRDPYEGEDFLKIIPQIVDPAINKRPPIPTSCPTTMATIMKECVDSDPQTRPSFEELDLRLKRLTADSVDPRDSPFATYSRKKREGKAETLLHNVFPPHIAEALREGRKVEQEHHDCVTIFFSDVVGFTTISAQIGPQKVADLLDRVYSHFDDLTDKHDIYKVETVGDAFMCAANLVKNQNNDHVKRIAEFSIDAIAACQETLIDEDDPTKGCVRIRVGFHTGPVSSGVIGSKLPKYAVFGDTCNTASRMESNSSPGQIHCSETAAKLLQKQAPDLQVVSRGRIKVKGKDEMSTYWVYDKPDIERDGHNANGVSGEVAV